jgi:fatty acid desaturase
MIDMDVQPIAPLGHLPPSDQYGWVSVIKNTLPLLVLCSLLPYLADWEYWAAWACSPVIGLLLYRVSLVMHDCGHQSLFTEPQLNTRIGVLLGGLIGVDFQAYSTEHNLHHQNYGTQNDPQGFNYLGINKMGPVALRMHFIKGLLGFNLIHALHETVIAPRNLRRLIANGDILTVILAQFTLLIAVTDMGRHPTLALIPVISAVTFGLFLSQLRSMAEHGAYGDIREVGNVRSHTASLLSRLFLHDLNFNYHVEHHLYPDYPSVYLPEIHQLITGEESKPEYSHDLVSPHASMFNTLSSIISAAHSKPG